MTAARPAATIRQITTAIDNAEQDNPEPVSPRRAPGSAEVADLSAKTG